MDGDRKANQLMSWTLRKEGKGKTTNELAGYLHGWLEVFEDFMGQG